jgi:hypothetical protein
MMDLYVRYNIEEEEDRRRLCNRKIGKKVLFLGELYSNFYPVGPFITSLNLSHFSFLPIFFQYSRKIICNFKLYKPRP